MEAQADGQFMGTIQVERVIEYRVDRPVRSAIADHREDELLDPCPTLDIGAGHGTGHCRGVAVMLVMLFGQALVLFLFLRLTGELLVQLPELDLEFLERLPLDFILRVAFQVAAPAVVVLPEDVFGGAHQGKYSWTSYMRK